MSATAPTSPTIVPPPNIPAIEPTYIRAMSRLLLAGVVLSASILFVGLLRLLLLGVSSLNTGPVAFNFHSWVDALLAGEPDAIFLLGLVVLVLTPLSRVLLSILMFARERDRPFIAMTLFVLTMLVVSAFAGVLL